MIPVWNEEGNVDLLYRRCLPVLERTGRSWEMLYIDDGSTDNTFPILKKLHEEDPRVRVIRMRRNFGQTAALGAGFDLVRGRYVITIDGDLQNDPEDIPAILEKMDEGYHVVSGWRQNRKENIIKRRIPSIVANRMISWLSGVRLHDYGCTLKGYERRVVRQLHPYAEMHRFLPALASLSGARYTEVPVRDHPRHSGTSKYGLSRVGKVFIDMITLRMILQFSTKPRYWFGAISFPFGLTGLILGVITVYHYWFDPASPSMVVLPGATFLSFYLWFYLFSLGWIAELVSSSGTFRHGYIVENGGEPNHE